ncbi:MAG: hypothetical protein LBU28_10740 [Spirochaetaceae bacterium]|jgi:hypothetical protein|nr:hypothetical protein [Spirochaetaceae bacterium]
MTGAEMGRRYYRLALGAAQRRDLSAARVYAEFAGILAPDHGDAAHLAEICRYELGEGDAPDLEAAGLLAKQRKWKAAALAAQGLPHQSVRSLMVQGCLWALAKHDGRAADCFAGALAKDRGNRRAADALAEIGRRRRKIPKCFWRFF